MYLRLIRTLQNHHVLEVYPRGHYYSPLPSRRWVRSRRIDLFKRDVDIGSEVDLCESAQLELLHRMIADVDAFDEPRQPTKGFRYWSDNGFFGLGSGFALSFMMRHLRPDSIVEVGSGFSSALMLDVAERHLDPHPRLSFIEPYPDRLEELLRPEDEDRCRIIRRPVQEVPLETFDDLERDDILLVDSSHVTRIGSDVNHLLFEVLPRLRSGVLVHFHDVYWPFEYPQDWIEKGRAWNEAYILRAFLQYNRSFSVLLWPSFLVHRHPELVREHLSYAWPDPGGSIWLRKEG